MNISSVKNIKLNSIPITNKTCNPISCNITKSSGSVSFGQTSAYSANHQGTLKRAVSNSRRALLKPISSKEEYNMALKRLYRTEYFACGKFRNIFDDSGYEDVEDELRGLPLYCGLNDKSYLINSWLSGRKKDEIYETLDDRDIANAIRVFEYSLKKLDEKYGRFKGRLYRRGFFNPNSDRQYYSASDRFECADGFCHHINSQRFKPFSIIKVKNGHKIYDFQRDANSPVSLKYEKIEHEILIDRHSRFRKLDKDELSKEDIKDIKNAVRATFDFKPWQIVNLDKLDKKYDIYSNFSVWEEI